MKRIITAVLMLAVFTSFQVNGAETVSVFLDGTQLEFDVPPEIINGRTVVPLRRIAEAIFIDVKWDEHTETITLTKGETVNILTIGNLEATRVISGNKETVTLDVPPMLKDGRTLVPLRYVTESFNMTVGWDEALARVSLFSEDAPVPEFDEDVVEQVVRESVLMFEQTALPNSVFEQKSEYIKAINSEDTEGATLLINKAWGEAASAVFKNLLIDNLYPNYKLKDSAIDEITIEHIDDVSLLLITMKESDEMLLSPFVCIAVSGDKLNIFTAEKTINGSYMLNKNSGNKRETLGTVEGDKTEFIEGVTNALD